VVEVIRVSTVDVVTDERQLVTNPSGLPTHTHTHTRLSEKNDIHIAPLLRGFQLRQNVSGITALLYLQYGSM